MTFGILHLVEYQERRIPEGEFDRADALHLHAHFGDKVSVDWPTFINGFTYGLISQGWVGFIPLGNGKGVSIQPKVPLANIFEMLEYAYDLRSFKFLPGRFECETVLDYFERLAVLLAEGLLARSRIGLYKSYQEKADSLTFVRGRIDISAYIRSHQPHLLTCEFDEQTLDNEENQILAWTLHCVLRSGLCSPRSIDRIRKADKVLSHSVSLTPFVPEDCVGRTYNRLNADYETLHLLCRFLLEKTGPTQAMGDAAMLPFLVNMARLFESFVARWLAANLPAGYSVDAKVRHRVGGAGTLEMEFDLVLYQAASGRALCVLDTKYKPHQAISNPDYYQAVAYADAKGCGTAILVYPSPQTRPFDEKAGNVRVCSVVFDLGGELDVSGKVALERILSATGSRT